MTIKTTKNQVGFTKTKFSIFKLLSVLSLVVHFGINGVNGQTNPTAQSIPYTQNFGTATFSTMPTGMAAWNGLSGAALIVQTDAELSVPTANASLSSTPITAAQATGGVYGYAASSNARAYIQTSVNLTNGANQIVAAINTGSGVTSIRISYDLDLISPASTRPIGLVCQYRQGTSGTWTTVEGSNTVYTSGTSNRGDADALADFDRYSFGITGLTSRTDYQIRWAVTRGNSAGNSCGLGIDNIDIRAYSPTTYTYNGSGNLSTTTNWTPNPTNFTADDQLFVINSSVSTATVGSFTVTGNGSKIQIGSSGSSAVTFTVGNANPEVGHLDISTASSGTNTLVLNSSSTFPYFSSISNGTVQFSGGAAFTLPVSSIWGNLVIDGSSTAVNNPLTTSDRQDMKIAGNFTVQNSASIPSADRLQLLLSGSNNQTFTYSGTLTVRNFESNLTISNTGTTTFASGANLTCANNLTLNNTGSSNQFIDGGNTITLSGGGNVNLDGNAAGYNFTGTFNTTHTSGTTTNFRNSSASTGPIVATLNNVNHNGAGAIAFQSTGGGTISIAGNFSVISTSGAVTFGTSSTTPTFRFGGNYTYNRITAPAKQAGITFEFNGSVAQTLNSSVTGGEAFENFTNSNTNSITGLTIASNITVATSRAFTNSGILSLGTQTIGGSGAFTMSANSSFITSSTSGVDGNITASGTKTFSNNGCNYTFNGASTTVFPATGSIGSINNLKVGASITVNRPINLTGILSFTGNSRNLTTSGNITLKSSSTGTASIADLTNAGVNSGNSVTGNIIAERFVSSSGRRFRFLSSPVQSQTILEWRNQFAITGPGATTNSVVGDLNVNGWNQTYNNITNATPATSTSVRQYVEANSTSGNLNLGWGDVTTGTALTAGKGFRTFIRGPISGVITQLGINGNSTTQDAVTLSLTGAINSGDITPPSLTNSQTGWNLLGNPYPCAYNFNAHFDAGLVAEIANIGANVYVYDGTSNSYKSYNASSDISSGLTGGIVPSGAAFFIQATGAPTFVFKETYKTTTAPVALFKTDVSTLDFGIKYSKDETESDFMVVKMFEGATLNSERFDIKKISNENLNLSAYGQDDVQLTASCIPFVTDETRIKLNVEATEIGTYKFNFTNMDNFDAGVSVSLFDRFTNKTTDVRTNTVYTFEMGAGVNQWGKNRFELILNGKATTGVNNTIANKATNTTLSVYPNPATDVLNISLSNGTTIETVNIYNISGKLVNNTKLNGNQIDISQLNSGVYMVEVLTANGSFKTKFVK